MIFSESNDKRRRAPSTAGRPAFGRAGRRGRVRGAGRRRRGRGGRELQPWAGPPARSSRLPARAGLGAPAKRSGRPPLPALWFLGRKAGRGWPRHRRGAGQEVGARRPGAVLGLPRGSATRRAGDSGPLGTRRVTRASAETMAEEEGEGSRVQRASCRSWSREREAGARGAQRPGLRAVSGRGCARGGCVGGREGAGRRRRGDIWERSEWPEVLSASLGSKGGA